VRVRERVCESKREREREERERVRARECVRVRERERERERNREREKERVRARDRQRPQPARRLFPSDFDLLVQLIVLLVLTKDEAEGKVISDRMIRQITIPMVCDIVTVTIYLPQPLQPS
jgi:hypothetical protein